MAIRSQARGAQGPRNLKRGCRGIAGTPRRPIISFPFGIDSCPSVSYRSLFRIPSCGSIKSYDSHLGILRVPIIAFVNTWGPLAPYQSLLRIPRDSLAVCEWKSPGLPEGDGAQPTTSNTVEVHYHGTLTDGTVFDPPLTEDRPFHSLSAVSSRDGRRVWP